MSNEIQRTIISEKNESGNMQSISDQRVLVQCLHIREELSTQFTLIVTSQRLKKATLPTEERKYTIVQDARSHLVDQKF